jgi:tetratricopeptide (TPR) repeat protein
LTVRLPAPKRHGPSNQAISIEQLRHKIPGKAKKQYRRAAAEHSKGRIKKAIEHLENAISIDDLYVDAHTSLGVILLKAGQNDRALEQFQKVVRLAPHSAEAYSKAAFALVTAGHNVEAEIAARTALRQNSGSALAHYALGLSLLNLGRTSEKALLSLRHAAKQIPDARLGVAQMLENLGRTMEASKELHTYLNAGGADAEGHVAAWIHRLSGTEPSQEVLASNLE